MIRLPLPRGVRPVLPVLVLLSAACGGNLTSGGMSGVEVYVAGDDPRAEPAPTRAPEPLPPGLAALNSPSPSAVEGTVTVTLQVELMGDDRRWVEVTEGPQTITVALSGRGQSLLASRPVSAGRYIRARTTFRRVEAEVTRGLIVDGLDLRGTIPVDLRGVDGLVVEEPLFVEVREGEAGRLVVALNSQLWIRLVNALARRVDPANFRQAVRVWVLD